MKNIQMTRGNQDRFRTKKRLVAYIHLLFRMIFVYFWLVTRLESIHVHPLLPSWPSQNEKQKQSHFSAVVPMHFTLARPESYFPAV